MSEPIKTVRIEVVPRAPRTRGLLLRSRRVEITTAILALAVLLAVGSGFLGARLAANAASAGDGVGAGVGAGAGALAEFPVDTASGDAEVLRLGYFGNVTHALPVAGVQKGEYQSALGSTRLETQIFNAGPAAVEALNAGAIDAAYLGPNPAINSFVQSGGESVRIVSGAASGGAQLVVREGISSVADLRGATLATPNLGGTQDVALRVWLKQNGLLVDTTGGSDVTINPTANAQTLQLFRDGAIDGAWLPEPWSTRLVQEAGAGVLVDESSLWENGAFPTTVLAVNTEFLKKYPATVKKLLAAELETKDWLVSGLRSDPGATLSVVNAGLKATAGAGLPPSVLETSVQNLAFTADPNASLYPILLRNGVAAGVTKDSDVTGLFDLRILNELLAERGKNPVSAAGLGAD